MKRIFYFCIFYSSSILCSPYVVTPFARAISQRIYLCARLEKPIQFLKEQCSIYTKREENLFEEWERFRTFKQVNDCDYEAYFVKELFKAIYEDTVTKYTSNKDDIHLLPQVSTDAIAFRYFIIKRIGRLFSLLREAQNMVVFDVQEHIKQEGVTIEHPEIQTLLMALEKERCLLPLLNEWDHIVHYKNLSDTSYMRDFLIVTYLCMGQMIQDNGFHEVSENIAHMLTILDATFPRIKASLQKQSFHKSSFVQVLSNMGIPFLIVSLLAFGQLT